MKRKKRRLKKKPIIFIILVFILIIFLFSKCDGNSKKYDSNNSSKNTINKVKDNKKDNNKSMSIVMVGDVLIHESVYLDAKKSDGTYDFSKMFTDVKPLINDYDLKYCNQESIIGGFEASGYPNFNSPDEIGKNITDLGFNMISLANNHAYDKGEKGILYSVKYWNKYTDVITSGSYDSLESRNDIKIYEKNGIKFAFLSYTTGINGNSLNGKDYLVNIYDKDKVKNDIEKVKDDTDLIIVAMHWGNEYTNEPTNSQKEIANYLSSLGVDLIIGTHPHVVQPIEYINDTLVIYSLGNFISNQLVMGLNPAIGLLLGIDINISDDNVTFNIRKEELIYSYSNNSKNFKVIPFSKMTNEILPNYKTVLEEYLNIVNKNL